MPKTARPLLRKTTYCSICGTAYVFYRIKGRNKSRGHLKHVYCYTCKKETEHREEAPLKHAEGEAVTSAQVRIEAKGIAIEKREENIHA